MKHIKRKFTNQELIDYQKRNETIRDGIYVPIEQMGQTKPSKGFEILLDLEDNTVVKAFHYKEGKNNYYIPEPDPILILYDQAYRSFLEISRSKGELLRGFQYDNNGTETTKMDTQIHKLYTFYGLCCGYTINLFTSIEAFLNKMIPDDFNYVDEKKDKTFIYNKKQIEKGISFDIKYKTILKQITNKDFASKYQIKNQHITNLKALRDNIVHIKANKEGHTPYDHIFKRTLTFKYKETLLAVKDLMNYYHDSYIEECPCNEDF